MVRNVATVTWYVSRRKRRGLRPGKEDEVTYQVWLVLAVCPEVADTASEPAVNHCLDVGTGHKAGERLKEAVAEVLAGRLEGVVWKTTDDLSEEQVAGLLAGLPDMVKTLALKPLDMLGDAAGLPALVVSLGADVTATLVLEPVLEPLQSTVRVLEVVGIVLGLVTGLHPLVITCVKHLAYDELGDALTRAFEQVMSPPDAQALGAQPPALGHAMELSSAGKPSAARAGPSHGTAGESMAHRVPDSGYVALRRLAESAAASARSRNRTAAVNPQSEISPRPSIPTAVRLSLEVNAAQEKHGFSVTGRQNDEDLPPTGLLRPRANPASVTESINAVSNPYTLSRPR